MWVLGFEPGSSVRAFSPSYLLSHLSSACTANFVDHKEHRAWGEPAGLGLGFLSPSLAVGSALGTTVVLALQVSAALASQEPTI